MSRLSTLRQLQINVTAVLFSLDYPRLFLKLSNDDHLMLIEKWRIPNLVVTHLYFATATAAVIFTPFLTTLL